MLIESLYLYTHTRIPHTTIQRYTYIHCFFWLSYFVVCFRFGLSIFIVFPFLLVPELSLHLSISSSDNLYPRVADGRDRDYIEYRVEVRRNKTWYIRYILCSYKHLNSRLKTYLFLNGTSSDYKYPHDAHKYPLSSISFPLTLSRSLRQRLN